MPDNNELTDIVTAIAGQGESTIPLVPTSPLAAHPYDPIKNIVSLLTAPIKKQKKKTRKGKNTGASVGGEEGQTDSVIRVNDSSDSDDDNEDEVQQADYQGPNFFNDYLHDRQHIRTKQLKCDVPVLLVARYLARALNNAKGVLEYILDNSEGFDAVAKIGLVAMRERYIKSKKTCLDPRYAEMLKLSVKDIAREFALQIYEKMAFSIYSINNQDLAVHNSPLVTFRRYTLPEGKLQDCSLPSKSFVPLDPVPLIAANALYRFLCGSTNDGSPFDDRLKTIASPRELAILVGCKALREVVLDEKIGREIDAVLQGRCNLRTAVYATVAYYNLALMENKTK